MAGERHRRSGARPEPAEVGVVVVDPLEGRRHPCAHVRDRRLLVAADRRDVHELEGRAGERLGGHAGILPGRVHNPSVSRRPPPPAPERGFVVAVLAPGTDAEDELTELRELARTALVEPVEELIQQRRQPEPRTYVGKGKLEELKGAYSTAAAEVLLVDDELSPSQQRTLENALQARV